MYRAGSRLQLVVAPHHGASFPPVTDSILNLQRNSKLKLKRKKTNVTFVRGCRVCLFCVKMERARIKINHSDFFFFFGDI